MLQHQQNYVEKTTVKPRKGIYTDMQVINTYYLKTLKPNSPNNKDNQAFKCTEALSASPGHFHA